MLIKQISVFVENKLGGLHEVTNIIALSGATIRAFSLADTMDFGILRVIVDDPDACLKTFAENGIAATSTAVLAVRLRDKPGAFDEILRTAMEQSVFIEYAYAFNSAKNEDAALILKLTDVENAAGKMIGAGIEVLSAAKVYTVSGKRCLLRK